MRSFSTLVFLFAAFPAYAQPAVHAASELPGPQAERDDRRAPVGGEILVVATRLQGQIDAPQAPIATFDEAEIQALGASSVGELLARVSPQTGSGRGRSGGGMPVVLVNGARITNFREMRNFPPEAIKRVEILPEEVAQRFGFPPDTRVVNLILKDHYRSRSVSGTYSLPTLGGFSVWQLEATLAKIDKGSRLTVTASTDDTTPLFESERPLVQSPANIPSLASDPNPAAFRSLIGDSRNFGLNLAWTKALGKDGLGGALSLNGNIARAESHTWQGLDLVELTAPGGAVLLRALPDPIEQVSRVTTYQAGAGYNGQIGRWQFSATVDATRVESRSLTDRRADSSTLVAAAAAGTLPINGPLPVVPAAGQDASQSDSNRIEGLVTMIGRPVRLPAGQVTATIKSGFTWIGFESSDQRSVAGPVSLRRLRLLSGLNLSIPLTSRREGFLAGAGDFTLNLGGDWTHLSDFGAVVSWSAGLTWAPSGRLNLQASYIVNEAAPAISQLGNPLTVVVNVPVYDFTRGETALVEVTSGGNPLLLKERQRDLKFSANWQLPFVANSSLLVEYFRNRSSDVTAAFPLLTPAIEAAFPGRLTRDGTGRLVAIDQRPVTFARQESARLRWGFNLAGTIGKAPEGGGGMIPGMGGGGSRGTGQGGAPRGGGGRGGGGMMAAMMGGGGGQGRWSLGLYHTAQFSSSVLIAPGGPVLDLLGGDALSTGGSPRHSIEFNGGAFFKGFGLFSQGTWSAPTKVAASGLPGTSDLRFGSVASVNLFLFADFSMKPKLVKQVPFLKGARMSLRFENLLGSRQKVTDASGTVPLSYQADYLDPRGRVISLEFRKLF